MVFFLLNFMKIFLLLTLCFLSFSCSSDYTKEEAKKNLKSRSASERINSSSENSKNVLKDLDE